MHGSSGMTLVLKMNWRTIINVVVNSWKNITRCYFCPIGRGNRILKLAAEDKQQSAPWYSCCDNKLHGIINQTTRVRNRFLRWAVQLSSSKGIIFDHRARATKCRWHRKKKVQLWSDIFFYWQVVHPEWHFTSETKPCGNY